MIIFFYKLDILDTSEGSPVNTRLLERMEFYEEAKAR